MRTCPYCKREAVTFWQKATLGTARTLPCQSCGKQVSVGARSSWGVVPFLAGLAIAGYLALSPLGIAAAVAGTVAMFLVHEFAVPLVGRDPSGKPPKHRRGS
jgi:hypothetical protein